MRKVNYMQKSDQKKKQKKVNDDLPDHVTHVVLIGTFVSVLVP